MTMMTVIMMVGITVITFPQDNTQNVYSRKHIRTLGRWDTRWSTIRRVTGASLPRGQDQNGKRQAQAILSEVPGGGKFRLFQESHLSCLPFR